MSAQQLASQTVTDAAVALSISAPTARDDLALAWRHRPVLLFDESESVPRPLAVDPLFAAGKIHQCPAPGRVRPGCGDPVTDPAQLENGGTYLKLDLPKKKELVAVAKRERRLAESSPAMSAGAKSPGAPPAGTLSTGTMSNEPIPGAPASTIYVHPVNREVNGRRRIYLDYWWYLSDNPARSGAGAFCGAGLVIPGVTCFDHRSDWEGITVVLQQGAAPDPELVEVHYSQHDRIVAYPWRHLRAYWDKRAAEYEPLLRSTGDVSDRPLVFVARGTHASYPIRCRGNCRQTAHDRQENRANGTLPWLGNRSSRCEGAPDCLTPLPTRAGGVEGALWNAFDGPWGRGRCVLWYCDSSKPPQAPGAQGRFEHPWRCSGYGDLNARKRFNAGTCE